MITKREAFEATKYRLYHYNKKYRNLIIGAIKRSIEEAIERGEFSSSVIVTKRGVPNEQLMLDGINFFFKEHGFDLHTINYQNENEYEFRLNWRF